jgi:anaerobic selenocysteine-containing dehydrogenase
MLLGRRFKADGYPWNSVEDMLDTILEPSGYTYQGLQEHGPIYPDYEYYKFEKGLLRPDGELGFSTPTGRIELYSTLFEHFGMDPLPTFNEPSMGPEATPELYEEYPFILMSGVRITTMFHSEHRQIPYMRLFNSDPLIEMNAEDAKAMDINEGDWVWIENPNGKIRQRAHLTLGIEPGMALCQHGWWYPEAEPSSPHLYGMWEVNANQLLKNKPHPVCGFGSDVKCVLCKIYKVSEEEISR